MVAACKHPLFDAHATVVRQLRDGFANPTFAVDLRVRCASCNQRFIFLGLSVGVHPDRPTMSFDGHEARLPIIEKMPVGEWSDRRDDSQFEN